MSTYGVVVNVLDCDSVGSEFEHKSNLYVHFLTNILEKGMNPFIPPLAMVWIVQLRFIYKDGFGIN